MRVSILPLILELIESALLKIYKKNFAVERFLKISRTKDLEKFRGENFHEKANNHENAKVSSSKKVSFFKLQNLLSTVYGLNII